MNETARPDSDSADLGDSGPSTRVEATMEQHEPAIAVARRRAMLKGLRSRTRLIAGAGGVLAAATVGISVLNASLTQPLFPPLYGGVASLYLLAGFGGVVLALLLRISRYGTRQAI